MNFEIVDGYLKVMPEDLSFLWGSLLVVISRHRSMSVSCRTAPRQD